MTIYLTKTADGKTYHFRITTDESGLDIIQGIFYISMEKYWQGFDNEKEAQEEGKRLIDEKLREGNVMFLRFELRCQLNGPGAIRRRSHALPTFRRARKQVKEALLIILVRDNFAPVWYS